MSSERVPENGTNTSTEIPVLIVVMGVSGCGKSTLAKAIAQALSIPFLDGDDLHPPANVEKMSRGVPLLDADRAPWLVRIRDQAQRAVDDAGSRGVVVACSALKKSYRDILRGTRVTLEDVDEGMNTTDVLRSAREHAPPGHPSQPFDSPETRDARAHAGPDVPAHEPLGAHVLRTVFVHPHGLRDVLFARMEQRQGHFMKAKMLESQLDTLEDPREDGTGDVIQVDLQKPVDAQVQESLERLKGMNVL